MKIDGIELLGASKADNLSIVSGISLPTVGNNLGELFYLSAGATGLYVYNGSVWDQLGVSGASGVTSVAGTTNQVIVSSSTGNVTISLPQNIHTAATPTFAQITVAGNPTGNLQVATKQYVDSLVGSGGVTSVGVSGGTTGLVTTGGPITTSGTITLSGTLGISNGGTGATTPADAINALLPSQSSNAGKVLGTNGATASWIAPSASTLTGGATYQVPYQSGVSTTAFSDNLRFIDQTILSLGSAPSGTVYFRGGNNTHFTNSDAQYSLTVAPATLDTVSDVHPTSLSVHAADSSLARTAGSAFIRGGDTISSGDAGSITIRGGNTGSGIAGSVFITAGNATSGTDGDVVITTNNTRRFAVTASGAITVGSSATGYGTSGQVLTSNGDAPPTWTTPATFGSVTSVNASGGTTGLTFSGGPITTSGTLTLAGTLGIANGGTNATTAVAARTNLLPDQTSQSGKVLKSNGTDVVWGDAADIGYTAENIANKNQANGYAGLDGSAKIPTSLLPTISATVLNGTGVITKSTTVSGAYGGLDNNVPNIWINNVTGSATNRGARISVDNAGSLVGAFTNDAGTAETAFLKVDRTGQTATALAITSTATTISGTLGVSGALSIGAGGTATGTITTTALTFKNQVLFSASTGSFVDPDVGVERGIKVGNGGIAYLGGLKGDSITVSGNITSSSGTITGNGSGLTTLNASNLSTGTVATARLGSGTANNTVFLRGDSTWASPSVSSVQATADWGLNTSTIGTYVGIRDASTPGLAINSGSSTANTKLWDFVANATTGDLTFRLANDANSSFVNWLRVQRTATTASTITITATNIALAGDVIGTSFTGVGTALTALNASNLGSGTVPVARIGSSGTANSTTFLRGDNTWATPTASVTSLQGTTDWGLSTSVSGLYAGTRATNTPGIAFNSGSGTADSKLWEIITPAGSNDMLFRLLNDSNGSPINWLRALRSGQTITTLDFTANATSFSGSISTPSSVTANAFSGPGSGITALNASNLGSGTVPVARLGSSGTANSTTFLRGDNTWAAVSANVLNADAALTFSTAAPYLSAGIQNSAPTIVMGNTAATSGTRTMKQYVGATGNYVLAFTSDDSTTSSTPFVTVARTANNATIFAIDSASTTISGNLTVSGGTGISGVGTSLTALNATNLGSGTVAVARLGSSGTRDNTTFLRGDNTWVTPPGVQLDAVNTFTKAQIVAPSGLTDGATISIDASLSNNFRVVLAGNRTLANPTNLVNGQIINIILVQDASGGRTITFGSMYKWAGGTVPSLSTSGNSIDVLSAIYDSTSGFLLCAMNKTFS